MARDPAAERRCERIMARMHALITRRQALRAGMTARQIDRRVIAGEWIVVTRGLYRAAAAPVSWLQAAYGPCLLRADAVTSFVTAAAVLGYLRAPVVPHVIVPPQASGRLPIAVVHRAVVPACDRTRVGVIPCTGLARTIVDCAAVLDDTVLEQLVDDALSSRRTSRAAVEAAATRAATGARPGASRLRRVLAVWTPGIGPDSPAEARLLRTLDQWGFPPPARQHRVRDASGREIARLDAAWPESRIALEYDSPRFHSPRLWVHDEARHAGVRRLGWTIRHVDKADLMPDDDRLRRDLELILPKRLVPAV